MLDAALNCDHGGRIFDLGVKERFFPLRTWSSPKHGRIVLIGDSAHPMPPFLGQGANQAMQDAYCVVQLITEYNRNLAGKDQVARQHSVQSIQDIGRQLYQRRMRSSAILSVKSSVLGRIETLGGTAGVMFKEGFFRVAGRAGVIQRELLHAAIPQL